MIYEDFINKVRLKHGNKYEYEKFIKATSNDFIKIICKKHGLFEQRLRKHLEGSGCHLCARNIKKDINSFIIEANKIHNNKYDYSKSLYTGSLNKLTITCPIHGDFEQIASNHLRGFGCKKCYLDNANLELKYTNDQFIYKSKLIHNYNYEKTQYNNSKTKVIITCPIHGDFEQIAGNHLSGFGCKKCSELISTKHQEIINWLNDKNIKLIINDKNIISPYEIDIFIPSLNLGIEYHGLYWHSIKNNRLLHYSKCNIAINKGIKLIQIFENEWLENSDIIKSMLSYNLKLIETKIYARKCSIKELTNDEYNKFCKNNHIQGIRTTNIKIGLIFNNKLIQVLGINKHHKYNYEIIRLCSKLNISIVGGASKLLSYFIKNFNPETIMTYADRRYSVGDIYLKLNFKLLKITSPNYFYTKGTKLLSRQQFQKHKLESKLANFNSSLSESQNMLNNGFRKIWDAGHYKFIWGNYM